MLLSKWLFISTVHEYGYQIVLKKYGSCFFLQSPWLRVLSCECLTVVMVSPHRRSDSGGQVEPRASFLRDGCTRCHSGGHVTGCVPCGHAENPATQVSVSHVLYPQGRHIQCCFSHKPLLWAHTDTPLPFSVDIHVHLSVSVSVSVSSPEAVWLSHTLKCAGSSPSFSLCVCVCVRVYVQTWTC